jgi:hypothetical protein
MRRLAFLLLPLAAVALIAAGCGSDESDGTDTAAASRGEAMKSEDAMEGGEAMEPDSKMTSEGAMKAEASMSAKGARVKVVDSDFGRVIADGRGGLLPLRQGELGETALLRSLRPGLAARTYARQADGRQRRQAEPARHHQAEQRQAPGHLCRSPALLLRRRLPRHDPLPRRRRVRRDLARGRARRRGGVEEPHKQKTLGDPRVFCPEGLGVEPVTASAPD